MILGTISGDSLKAYCLDTSGFSNPLETMPEDIHSILWARVADKVNAGRLAVTYEIYEELEHLPGPIGACIKANKDNLVLDIGDNGWNWNAYLGHVQRMKTAYKEFIADYNGGRKGTVGLNDISIIALGKTLSLPVVSMEAPMGQVSATRKRIPEVCMMEKIAHLNFNEFLRAEGIKN